MNKKIKSFTDIFAWKQSHKLVLMVYKLTKSFPKSERFGLVDQMRRAAVSITSNIAEGFSRKGYREKLQFYYRSLGSLTELQNQLLISRDIGYLNEENFGLLANQAVSVHKLFNRLISKTKSYIKK